VRAAPAQEIGMQAETKFISATPVLASLDIARSVDFYVSKLACTVIHAEQGVYGIVSLGALALHFWACTDRRIAEATSCRVDVSGIDAWFAHCTQAGIVHPNAPLHDTPWGTREFAVLDVDGNLITFCERAAG
jgi:catechol 2,3-dioxygenase-like lactoylglutathione lyase family enzyme